MQNKFFTIILPIYNPTKLKRALDSIESQPNKKDIEVIIVNDNGSRDFEKILSDYTFNYKVIHNQTNLGQGLARQVGIDNSDGEWITFLDHDDEFNPNCFKAVKDDIIASDCIFLYSTQSLIANGYSFAEKQDFAVEDSGSVLHGHFYNRKMLEHYNIRFTEKVRAHEDTYFLNCVEGILLLDKSLGETAKICSPLVTYYWYLWEDSTSHSYNGGISYLEDTIHDYLTAMWESFIHTTLYCKITDEYMYVKLCGTLMCTYWFEQSFKYLNPMGWKMENETYIKDFVIKVMRRFNLTDIAELTNVLLDLPELFTMSYKGTLANVDGAFVPRETIEQFYQNLFKEENKNDVQ